MNTSSVRVHPAQRAAARLVAAALGIALAVSCAAPVPTPVLTPKPTPQPGSVSVQSRAPGWSVYLDGNEVGATPLTLQLAPGTYVIEVRRQGVQVLKDTLTVRSGDQRTVTALGPDILAPTVVLSSLPSEVIAGEMVNVVARAQDDERVLWLRLLLDDRVLAETNGPLLEYQWDTQTSGAGGHRIRAQAEDAAGNQGQATAVVEVRPLPTAVPTLTPVPTFTPAPTPAPTVPAQSFSASDLQVSDTTLVLPTYPYEAFLRSETDPRYNLPFWTLDRDRYEASQPRPQPRTFQAVVLENRFLRLVFLPELGGRLYQCTWKSTGQGLFYQNAVLRPSYWGPLDRNQNWWLAAGGMEWAVPVNEHGYLSGLPWSYEVQRQESQAVITLRSPGDQRSLLTEIRVILPSESAHFIVRPRLLNRAGQPMSLQFWTNAMLTLGSSSVSPSTEFLCPTQKMIVHSTGDSSLPGERQEMSWPVHDGRNLAQYGNWRNWLGVFSAGLQDGYVGAYNHQTELGVVRLFPKEVARGVKLFAFGAGFPSLSEFADDRTDYFELWGGPCRTFWPEDNLVLAAGQEMLWSEVWLPIRGIGGLDRANAEVAVKTTVQSGQVTVGVAAARARLVQVTLLWKADTVQEQTLALTPGTSSQINIPVPANLALPAILTIRIRDAQGNVLLEYVKDAAS